MANPGGGDWLAWLRRLEREANDLRKRLCRGEELLDGIVRDIGRLAGNLKAARLGDTTVSRGTASGCRCGARGTIRRKPSVVTGLGVARLKIRMRRNGSSRIRVDGGKAFLLTRSLTELLRIIASDGGEGKELVVGWKSKRDIVLQMEKVFGRSFGRHTLDNLIYRLRRDLIDKGDVHPGLLQTDRRRGVRFALRRGELDVMQEEGT